MIRFVMGVCIRRNARMPLIKCVCVCVASMLLAMLSQRNEEKLNDMDTILYTYRVGF